MIVQAHFCVLILLLESLTACQRVACCHLQISDLHISVHDPMGHTPHFLHFLSTVLPALSPSFVLATGDLTDAKDSAKITSAQIEAEWLTYKRALTEAGVMNRTEYWYDLRGNHDCFNVPDYNS